MDKKQLQLTYKELQNTLTARDFLQNAGLHKKDVLAVMDKGVWLEAMEKLMTGEVSCRNVLNLCSPAMENFAGSRPKDGWLPALYGHMIRKIYPHRDDIPETDQYDKAAAFYLECLRFFLNKEKERLPFSRIRDFDFATEEELEGSPYEEEYRRFLQCFSDAYLYELMRIGREIMPFDMLAHVAGVHHIAMHIARQLAKTGIPVDLPLISGAAAAHDIGKYGCRENEVRRIPYLHYYYTDLWCRVHELPNIGHIAANHSTWDLELENLTVESLILIYADFRVKNNGYDEKGKEIMGFYSLASSFAVILNKLDNVDTAKENRYRHVYSRLEDFENYMKALGVNVDLTSCALKPVPQRNPALLDIDETVDAFKNIAIDHNIRLMHKLSRELTFGDILEAARSTRNWKDTRAYLNIFAEYFTYMNQRQKQMAMNFLYDLMFHREGDIRRQAADLLGNMIAHYDVEYGKELPQNVNVILDETDSFQLWKRYLDRIILPDHKVIDRHRRWLGYCLKRVVISLLENCKEEQRKKYVVPLLAYYQELGWIDETAFILLDTMPSIPMVLLDDAERNVCFRFMEHFASRDVLEIQAAILLNLCEMAPAFTESKEFLHTVNAVLDVVPVKEEKALAYLAYEIRKNCGLPQKNKAAYQEIFEDSAVVSDIFLDNLKAATPWKMKIINMRLLYDRICSGVTMPKLHVATHLSNLLKVSEQVSVRHAAGETLVKLAPMLSWDQRNEVAIELTKGLEIGEFEFSKYIPQYLGEFVLFLHPKELDEFIKDLERLQNSTNDRIASVALDTFGVMLQHYGQYQSRFPELAQVYEDRRKKIMGMILKGFANYQENVKREAFWVVGHELFAQDYLSMQEKKNLFGFLSKKMLMLVEQDEDSELTFFNHTAGWKFVYHFISAYIFQEKKFTFSEPQKIAFFPGTFDPFTLGHKEIAREIRDLGFTVYLALDEFSWSKKAQPHRVRRRILDMSVANEENIFLFPSDTPVNIANPADLKKLREMFPGKEVYMVAGSDVVQNASSYRMEPEENSIMTFPHVIFRRETREGRGNKTSYDMIQNTVVELKLPTHFEDISSTRIRENIDHNRDISNLIDTVAQNYIYDRGLYLREPQYKRLLQTKAVEIKHETNAKDIAEIIRQGNLGNDESEKLLHTLQEPGCTATIIFDQDGKGRPDAIMLYRHISTTELFGEFQDMMTASYIRQQTSGKIVLILAGYIRSRSKIADLEQIVLTETLAECLRQDYTYTVCSPKYSQITKSMKDALERQGFIPVPLPEVPREIYVVDMKQPVVLYHNVQTAIKEPFSTNPRVLRVLDESHKRFQRSLTKLYPGELVLSFNAGIMYNRLIELITAANGMPKEPLPVRTLGKNMCVPFGKILKGIVIPNTVTKVLHTDKVFDSRIHGFRIAEFPEYLPLRSQVRTIKSFRRPVILVDDLLHKGYRIRELDPLFKEENVEIDRLIVGMLSGRGKDLMEIQGRKVESAYFIPSMRIWFVETSMYPFIGGDGVETNADKTGNFLHGVNLILPYVMPGFIRGASKENIYDLSMVCLQNTKEILTVLEEEYQALYERNLTLGRLSEVVIWPRIPDKGNCVAYDYHLPASVYLENDMEQMIRLEHLVK